VDRLLLLVAVTAACAANAPRPQPAANTPTTPTAPGTVGTTPPPPGKATLGLERCVEDTKARDACVAKGAGWQYSDPPPRNCSGVDRRDPQPPPAPPCECIETAEYHRLIKKCSEVP